MAFAHAQAVSFFQVHVYQLVLQVTLILMELAFNADPLVHPALILQVSVPAALRLLF